MTAITEAEVRPGLCAFLDPQVLAACPGVRSNVRARTNLVNRPGPFLLVAARPDGDFLCVPLVSNPGFGRQLLDQALKTGPGNGWTLRNSYFSVHQFWIIPPDCVLQASEAEISPVGRRQRYADTAPAALAAVADRQFDSDTPYRPVAALR